MEASVGVPEVKVTAVFVAVGLTTAFAVGNTLAHLTDRDALSSDVGFLAPGNEGLITLSEARWESDAAEASGVHGRAYAERGILPGDTLAQDPKVTINAWAMAGDVASPNAQPIYVFMRVTVPKADAEGDARVLFDYTTNAGWALIARNDVATDAHGQPAAVYVYVYTGNDGDEGTTTASHVTPVVVPKARVFGDDVPELFSSVTFTPDATFTPSTSRIVGVDAYAIQVSGLTDSSASTVYQLASGEAVDSWAS